MPWSETRTYQKENENACAGMRDVDESQSCLSSE